jgi:hypothetical protein
VSGLDVLDGVVERNRELVVGDRAERGSDLLFEVFGLELVLLDAAGGEGHVKGVQ